jgi:hypothetical protein|tara:strand:+ start:330 stop:521 length:192 start_codon:yes stop_codon:yes gene_type:complete
MEWYQTINGIDFAIIFIYVFHYLRLDKKITHLESQADSWRQIAMDLKTDINKYPITQGENNDK